MSELSSRSETIRDGGFQIDVQPNELAVTADKSAWKTRSKTPMGRILSGLIFVAAAAVLIIDLVPRFSEDGSLVLAFTALAFAPFMLLAYVPGCKNLQCNRECIQVIRVARGHVQSAVIYPRESVQKIRFGAVSYDDSGAINALIFTVEGRNVKVLEGLESPEALRILKELNRLGFDTVHDVGLPMMADMAIERRHWLGR